MSAPQKTEAVGRQSPAERGRAYSNRKYLLAVLETLYCLALPVFFLKSGLSRQFDGFLSARFPAWLSMVLFLLAGLGALSLLTLPVDLYRSLFLERSFGLSRQSVPGWLTDRAKSLLVSCMVSLAGISVLYAAMAAFPLYWWLVFSAAWLAFSLAAAFVFPALIVPLFFTYRPLRRIPLARRAEALAKRMGVAVNGVYEIDLGKRTVKANAGLLGWGALRRVVVSDTMCEAYSDDEIEVILAHEFAHQKFGHVFILAGCDAVCACGASYALFLSAHALVRVFGCDSLASLSAMPLLFLYSLAAGVVFQPLKNFLGRALERQADREALTATNLRDAFVSSMRRLAANNLSDPSPHPLVKIFFFDHPPVAERIAAA